MSHKMRKIFLICLLAIGYFAQSQVPTALPTLYNGKIYEYTQYLATDSGFFSARRDTNFIPKQGGCIVFKTSDSTLYISTGRVTGIKWKGVGSGGGVGVYNAGYGLTLLSGTFKVDTSLIGTVGYNLYLYNLLDGKKVNKTDTATMLLPYLRKADTTAMLIPYLRKADTITLSRRIDLKLTNTDTVAMLLPYLRKADTITLSRRIDLKRDVNDTTTAPTSTLTRGKGQYLIDSLAAISASSYSPIYNRVKIVGDSNYSVTAEPVNSEYDVYFFKSATADRLINIPSASIFIGRKLTFVSIDTSSKRDFIVGGLSNVLDLSGATLGFLPFQQTFVLISDGNNWIATQIYIL